MADYDPVKHEKIPPGKSWWTMSYAEKLIWKEMNLEKRIEYCTLSKEEMKLFWSVQRRKWLNEQNAIATKKRDDNMEKYRQAKNKIYGDYKDVIPAGKYLSGLSTFTEPLTNMKIGLKEDSIRIFQDSITGTTKKGKILFSSIKNISVENASTVEKRITATRLLALGVFAFALKKDAVSNLFYLIIEISEGRFDSEVIFEFSGSTASADAGKLRAKLIESITRFEESAAVKAD